MKTKISEKEAKAILDAAWKKRFRLLVASSWLIDECRKLQPTDSNKLYAKSENLRAESEKLRAEADMLWFDAVLKVHGNIPVQWIWREDKGFYACRLATGEVFEP